MDKYVKLYISSVVAISLFLFIYNFPQLFQDLDFTEILFFLVLIMLSEFFSIKDSNFSNISLGFSIAFTTIVVFTPEQSAALLFLGFLFSIYRTEEGVSHLFNGAFHKRLFNASSYYLTAYVSGDFFHAVNGMDQVRLSGYGIIALLLTIIVYYLINTSLFMVLFSLINQIKLTDFIMKNLWALKSFVTLSPLGIMMLLFYTSYGWFGLLLFFGPLILARYSYTLYLEMKRVYLETITALTKAVDAKDEYTRNHSTRVADYAMMIAREMKLPENRIENLYTAALLHDVGKIGISDNILLKPSGLTEAEYRLIKDHPLMGARIIEDVDFLKDASRFIAQHHEHYDGTGYPLGLAGDEILVESGIIAVADSFDAMTTDRAYRKGFSEEKAFEILAGESASQFHPQVVAAFVRIREARGQVKIHAD